MRASFVGLVRSYALVVLGVPLVGCVAISNRTRTYLPEEKYNTAGPVRLEEIESVRLRVIAPSVVAGELEGTLAYAALCHARRTDAMTTIRPYAIEWADANGKRINPWTDVAAEFLVAIPAIAAGGGLWCLGEGGNINCAPGNGDSGGQVLGATLAGIGAVFILGGLADAIAVGLLDNSGYHLDKETHTIPIDLGVQPCAERPVGGKIGTITMAGETYNVMTDSRGWFRVAVRRADVRAYLDLDGESIWFDTQEALAGGSP